MSGILEKTGDYRDLSSLDYRELKQISTELRDTILNVVSENGGHMASSLGAVEMIVALLRVFDPSRDKIIFDVGHQAYAYKILTGRKNRFDTLRRWGGISGFPDPKESSFDHFNGGHSSKSLSAALGFAKARDILNQKHSVVAVIGDGSLMNGLALEALNNAHEVDSPVIFVLNDNQMSINRRVGGMANHLAALSVSPAYKKFKNLVKYFCRKIPSGNRIESFLEKTKQKIKGFLLPANMFEEIGISYWGPFDGHNIREMERIFSLARYYEFPLLIHLLTQKGRGFKPAEESPVRFHGVPPRKKAPQSPSLSNPCWSLASASCIEELARKDSRVVCMTAAMKEGSKLNRFAEIYPDRFFDVGIAEGHLLTFAAGMACAGLIPVVSIYSTFLQRAMDQLVHDICMQNLPVILAIDRSGLVGEDGETHHGILDIPWCRPVPNLTLMAPRDIVDLRSMFNDALHAGTPCAIRLPRGTAPESISRNPGTLPAGWRSSERILEGTKWAVFAYGSTVPLAVQTFNDAWSQGAEPPSVYDLRFLKPLDEKTIMEALASNELIVVIEDVHTEGGIGEKISALANSKGFSCRVHSCGVPDEFIPHGSVKEQWEYCGLVSGEVMNLYHALPGKRTPGSGNCLPGTGGKPHQGTIPYTRGRSQG
ncbi:MAG: 1-deoxy-D-xylulose-5-phosphate synthase [Thermovirgaceae bacterium]|nr:1-deoxy-D-xylulose-5-phosphate synthase [Thermovirgaceae bacterium]